MCTFMVRPILEYAATVWSPHLQYQKQQINKVQCSAARFVTNDFSYYSSVSTMLDHLKWPCPYLNSKKYLKLICLQNAAWYGGGSYHTYSKLMFFPWSQPTFRCPSSRTETFFTHFYHLPLLCGALYPTHWLT